MALVTPVTTDQLLVSNRPERKQVTVLFCDIVDYTSWSTTIDPEDLAEQIHQFQSSCQRIAGKYQGHIAHFLGDGILILFGYPIGNEFSVHDAIMTAIELVDLSGRRANPFSLRIGISTSLVVISERAAPFRDELIFGEAPNLAARLQSMAQPNAILVSERSRRLAGNGFEFRRLGRHSIKGFREPIGVWQVRPKKGESIYLKRFRTPFIGREWELAMLDKHYCEALGGSTRLLCLHGAPGVGKSRLMRVFEKRVQHHRDFRIRIQCTKATQFQPFSAIVDEIYRWLSGFSRFGSTERRNGDIQWAMNKLGIGCPLHRRLFNQLIKYHCMQKRYAQHKSNTEIDLTLPENQRRIVSLLLDIINHMTKTHPVFLSIEDLHWADIGTVALIKGFANQFTGNGLFALFSVRSGSCPSLVEAEMNQPVIPIPLPPFDSLQSGIVVDKLFPQTPLPETVKHGIVAQTDGIPLYIEAFCWRLLDQLRSGTSSSSNYASIIPDSLQDQLNARIDSTEPYKTQLQIASVFGCEFRDADFMRVAKRNGFDAEPALQSLAALGLIEVTNPHEGFFRFCQTIIQQVAYQSLLKKHRQYYHQQIIDQLLSTRPYLLETQPEIFARHYGQLGQVCYATTLSIRAGNLAWKKRDMNAFLDHTTIAVLFASQINSTKLSKKYRKIIVESLAIASSYVNQVNNGLAQKNQIRRRCEELITLTKRHKNWPCLSALWRDLIESRGDLRVLREEPNNTTDKH